MLNTSLLSIIEEAGIAVLTLVPATLMWLRVYRKNQPEVFEYGPMPDASGARP